MDPNATLAAARAARRRYATATTEDDAINAATDMAAALADLDHWLSAGGFLPDAWTGGEMHPMWAGKERPRP